MVGSSASVVKAANEYFDTLVKSRFIEMFGTIENSHFEYTNVEDSCEILDSQRVPITAKDRVPGPYPYYGANGVQDYVADYIFDDDLVLLAEDGGHFDEVGRVAYLVSGKCWVNNHAHILKPKSCLNIYYLLNCLNLTNLSMEVNGTTRQKLTQAAMRKIKLPLPPIELQNQFADFVRQVDKSKLLFQQMVSKYDELVKSRFNEILNDELLAITELKNLITQDQTTEKIDNPEKEIFVTLQSRGKGAKQREITEGKTPVKFTGYRIKAGQFIYSRIDARNGAFDIVPTSLDGAVVSKDFPVFEIDSEKVNPVFLLSSVLQPSFIQQIQSNSFGATNRQRIKEDVLLKYMIKMPSMEIQNQFADFVRQVDKSKSEILEGIKRLKLQQIAEQ